MAEKKKYNSILISGRKDETLTYSRYIKDEESGESVKETLDKKVNVSDELETHQIKDGAITNEKLAADSVGNGNIQDGSVSNEKLAVNSITKDKLKDRTIGVEKLDPELRQTIAAATGLPEELVESIQNVDENLAKLNDTVYPITLGFSINPNVGSMQTDVRYSIIRWNPIHQNRWSKRNLQVCSNQGGQNWQECNPDSLSLLPRRKLSSHNER